MDLQNTFYLLGIIYMVMGILILLGIVILLFYIRNKIADIHGFVKTIVTDFNEGTIKPVQRVVDIAREILPKKKKQA